MLPLLPVEASTFAGQVDFLIILIAVLGGVWLFAAEAVFLYFCWRFRKKEGVKAQYITGEKKEEMKWIHWPHNLVLLCDVVIIVFAVRAWYNIKQDLPPPDVTIRVIGQQWSWRFVDPGLDGQLGTTDDVETVDELHVRTNTTYHFKLESLDVLHSFFVPAFRLKQDAIPGRVITGWFKTNDRTGTFDLLCAEICGIGHGIMKSKLVIESKDEHLKWLEKNKGTAVVAG